MASRVDLARRREFGPGSSTSSTGSRRFDIALEAVRGLQYRPEFTVREAPGPARLAPYSYAHTVDVELSEHHIGSGRLVILHDPAGQPSWQGSLRAVCYVDADVDLEVAADPVLPEVGWSWLVEALGDAQVEAEAIGGTVTQVSSRSFGVMQSRPAEGRLQLRASWTPLALDELAHHAQAWALLVALACGLSADPDVTSINR